LLSKRKHRAYLGCCDHGGSSNVFI
jgi:hypothetical protein